ncbi:MAG: methanogen output domain 1-containing protein [Acidobacteriota bacterium]
MITVDQLPDSRRAILIALKTEGPSTIAQLAELLQLTGEAVRQQLLQLQREGWVDSRIARSEERGRTGRPATRYSLTEAGDHLFPKNYDLLNIAFIDAVSDELGPDAAKRMLKRVSDDRAATVGASLRGKSLEERVEALKNFYLEGDPHMQVEKSDGNYRLVERNCPYINTAMQRPALCSVSVNALSRILGHRVEREKKFQNGDGRCVFLVHSDEPIDADTWEFKLESETT